MKDYYHILGLTPSCSQAEIKRAYRQLAIKYHPDKNNGDSESEERFKKIAQAYLVLGDTASRNAYDYTGGITKNYRSNKAGKTPVTYLILLRRVKERVLQANGIIDKSALFKVIDDLLSDETIKFLITVRDTATNNLIIDEVLTCCIFLEGDFKGKLYDKLSKLSDGDLTLKNKLEFLNKSYTGSYNSKEETNYTTTISTAKQEGENVPILFIFILVLLLLVFLIFVLSKSIIVQ